MQPARHVGVLAVELYTPPYYVDQDELEDHDGVSKGKYTKGLGQQYMSVCSDREDAASMAMTAVERLLRRTKIERGQIGRIDVGTESMVDMSKSIKSTLTALFTAHGNWSIAGSDLYNACYGGTAALFACVDWVTGCAWDGRYAIAIGSDIARYARGCARPTGGCGAVAMLVGPDAPLEIDAGLRVSYSEHVYDFFKPQFSVPYPAMDGRLSVKCYLRAVMNCYDMYCKRFQKSTGEECGVHTFDFAIFHSPFHKIVLKAFAELVALDAIHQESRAWEGRVAWEGVIDDVRSELSYRHGESSDSNTSSSTLGSSTCGDAPYPSLSEPLIRRILALPETMALFEAKVRASCVYPQCVGNLYTASLYSALSSLLCNANLEQGDRIVLFSYGSGLVSSMYSMTCRASSQWPIGQMSSQIPPLSERIKISTEQFEALCERHLKVFSTLHQHCTCHEADQRDQCKRASLFIPEGSVEDLFPGTFYLTQVDAMRRRCYKQRPCSEL